MRNFCFIGILITALAFWGCGGENKNVSELATSEGKPVSLSPSQVLICGVPQEVGTNLLDLSSLKVKKIDAIERFASVEKVLLGNNEFVTVPNLNKLKNLKFLDLSGNHISDLSFLAGLQNLEELNLSDNQIVLLSKMETLPKLKTITLLNNPVKYIDRPSYNYLRAKAIEILATVEGGADIVNVDEYIKQKNIRIVDGAIPSEDDGETENVLPNS